MDVNQLNQAMVTSLEELKTEQAAPASQVADFEQAMNRAPGNLGADLLNELGSIKTQFTEAKKDLEVRLSTTSDDPNSLMEMQWALMRITMQEELIAKTVGKMSQNVETLLKTQ